MTLSVVSVMILAGCQTTTDSYGRTVMSTPTLGQALDLQPQSNRLAAPYTPVNAVAGSQAQQVVGGKTVRVVAAQGGHQISVDGQTLAVDRDDDRVVIRSVHQGGGRTYVLIQEQSGGIACPAMYQAIDLSGPKPTISPPVGNCSDVPRVSVVGGAFQLTVPAFRAGI